MKTLVLQLARLGDIYQTWPVLRSLKREAAAGDEIHLLVREKFRGATAGLEALDRVWALDTRACLQPLIMDRPDIDAALAAIADLLDRLREEGFGRIINLSFSPFSSRFVHELTSNEAGEAVVHVHGYTRHPDGYLAIPDDASAYFFAQVGPGRKNRIHLTELFAAVAGCELRDGDWGRIATPRSGEGKKIAVHLGASQVEKTYGTHKWQQVIKGLLERTDAEIMLIGAEADRELAEPALSVRVAGASDDRSAVDHIGKTSLPGLFELLSDVDLLIGADSAPVHIAALTGTPVLNLSFASVSFWETGPKSVGSRILAFETPDDLASDIVVGEARAMLAGAEGDARAIHVKGRLQPYSLSSESSERETSPAWDWIQAIYMGHGFPRPESELMHSGLMRLFEANELALEQLNTLSTRTNDPTALSILDRFDEIIEMIGRMVPELGILVRWFQTERLRLGPMPVAELLARTRQLHEKLHEILGLYQNNRSDRNDDVGLG